MSADELITRCPSCSSRFKVTPGQLKIANNRVRCGNCLHVFSAVEHRDKPKSTVQRPEHSPRPPQTARTAPQSVAEHTQPDHNPAQPTENNTASIPSRVAVDQKPQPRPATTSKPEQPETEIPTLTVQPEAVVLESGLSVRKKSSPFLLIGCTLALLILAAQQLWFKRESLYWEPMLTPLYQQACNYLECGPFYRVNTEQIETQQLVIRNHNMYEGAATLYIRLFNHASFIQPYPAIKLSFKDLKGRLVSSRVFTPEDYLPAASDPFNLPSQKAVQISFDIMKPGARGVSYELELLAPDF